MDTLITLEEARAGLDFQRLLMADLQVIIGQRIRLKEMDDQIRLLNEGSQHVDSLLKIGNGIVQVGKIAAGSLEGLRASQYKFRIRAQILGRESALLIEEIFQNYDIGEEMFRRLDVEILSQEIARLDTDKRGNAPRYFQRIDSLSLKSKLLRAKLQTTNEVDLWLGVSAGRMSPDADPAYRMSLEFSYRFDDQPFRVKETGHPTRPEPEPPRPSVPDLQPLRDSIDHFRESLEKVERKVIAEVGYGSWESILNLNDFIAEYYEQGIQLTTLESARIRSLVSRARSFSDLPTVASLEGSGSSD